MTNVCFISLLSAGSARCVVSCGPMDERNFVDVAPAPSFGRIIAFDNWVFGCVKVFCRVAIGGLITAPKHGRMYDTDVNEPKYRRSSSTPRSLAR